MIVESPEFANQMRRFLPVDVLERTVERALFREHLASEVAELYRVALGEDAKGKGVFASAT